MGGLGENSSGDIFLAFSTANRGLAPRTRPRPCHWQCACSPTRRSSPLFEAAADATEEAIVNALCAATTMVGISGHVAHELPLDRLLTALRRYGRAPIPS